MAYQDKFTAKLAGPEVERAQAQLKRALPNPSTGAPAKTAYTPFADTTKAWYNNNPYSAANAFGEKTDYRPSGFGESYAANPQLSQTVAGFGSTPPTGIQDQLDVFGEGFDSSRAFAQLTGRMDPFGSFGSSGMQPSFGNGGFVPEESWQQGQWWNPYSQQQGQDPFGGIMGEGPGGPVQFKPGFGQFTPDVIPEINAAAAKWGIPAGFLYVIIAKESSGNWSGNSRPVSVSSRGGKRIHGYIGVFEDAARSYGFNFDAAIGNRAAQIDMLAGVLRGQYDRIRQQNPAYNWLNVASYHYSGNPNGGAAPADSVQHGSATKYMQDVANWWRSVQPGADFGASGPSGGNIGGSGAASGVGTGVNGIWGNSSSRVSQGFGRTSFSSGAGAHMYGYSSGLGLGSGAHPGIDYAMPSGTQLYIPVSGTVVYGGGSGYFRDYRGDGAGRGELRIKTDNGHLIILGHMSNIPWRPGQRVTAGQLAGLSGSFNGDHLHLEVRVPGNSSTGWVAVDPAQYFGSTSMIYGGGGPSTPQQAGGGSSTAPWWVSMWG